MKRVFVLLLTAVVLLSGCGQKASVPAWQDQYDLGVRYLSEGNYEEAIIAFTAAIEIEPNHAELYSFLADAYWGKGDTQVALDVLQEGYAQTGDAALNEKRLNWEAELAAIAEDGLVEEMRTLVSTVEIPFTVDNVVLGETGINTAKATYGGRPYAMSNLMNDDTEDSVYTCFGMNETPVPAGYEEMEFGFMFVGIPGGVVTHIAVNDSSFLCLGALSIGASSTDALELFGLTTIAERLSGEYNCDFDGGSLYYTGDAQEYYLTYTFGNRQVDVRAVNGTVRSIYMDVIA